MINIIEDILKQEDKRTLKLLTKAAGITKMEVSIHNCSFGHVLIGTLGNNVTAIEFGKDSDECYRNFINRWRGESFIAEPRVNFNIIDSVLKVIETGDHDPSIKVLFLDGTLFQRRVWEAIQTIEPGKNLSYKDIANAINHPKSFRAVGTACGANPVAVIVPCHRVLRSNGGDGGYRWGLDIKRKLLQRETPTNKVI